MVHRWRAVLGLQQKNFPRLLERGKTIYNGVSSNPTLFVTPNPPLAMLLGRLQAFDQAQQATITNTKGTGKARDVKAGELVSCLESTRTYIQELADASVPDEAAALIEAAGLMVRQERAYSKPLLQARQRKASGDVQVIANVGALTATTSGKVFFNWQSSPDEGKTWTTLPSTPKGCTSVAGLTPKETYTFRVSVTDTSGPGEWSSVVTLLVR